MTEHLKLQKEARKESLAMMSFIGDSPTSFHAIEQIRNALLHDGHKELQMGGAWDIKAGSGYFTTYNSTSLIAFHLGSGDLRKDGFRMVASHSDSPTFRLKPNGASQTNGQLARLATETYGGAILYSWMDRPLSLAGRVMLRNAQDPMNPTSRLFDFRRPIGVIPSVAIHFNRGVNEGARFNKQVDMQIACGSSVGLDDITLRQSIAEVLDVTDADILDFDLYAYDTTPGQIAGIDNMLVVCPKQDNLTMAYASLRAFQDAVKSSPATSKMLIVLDNEEVGSGTKQGAASPLVKDVVARICAKLDLGVEGTQRAIYNSFLVSADMAHAVHPNHPELADPNNQPTLNGGPVIKYNASQKYMTDADGAAVFQTACDIAGVPCQMFVNRSDIAGGSTLGNIMTGQLPLRGVDVGNPLLAMHSCCETGGVMDPLYVRKALATFYGMKALN